MPFLESGMGSGCFEKISSRASPSGCNWGPIPESEQMSSFESAAWSTFFEISETTT